MARVSLTRDTLETLRVSATKAAFSRGHAIAWHPPGARVRDGVETAMQLGQCSLPGCAAYVAVELIPLPGVSEIRGTALCSQCPTADLRIAP